MREAHARGKVRWAQRAVRTQAFMTDRRFVIAAVLVLGCARIDDVDPSGTPATDSGPAADASADIALRDDGCPATAADRKQPCPPGQVCKYYHCTGENRGIDILECVLPGEGTTFWSTGVLQCWQESGADGCPLGPPTGYASCTELGKVCTYRYCSAEGGGETSTYSCRFWEGLDGGLIFIRDSRGTCADAGT